MNAPNELRLLSIGPRVFKVIHLGSALHATMMRGRSRVTRASEDDEASETAQASTTTGIKRKRPSSQDGHVRQDIGQSLRDATDPAVDLVAWFRQRHPLVEEEKRVPMLNFVISTADKKVA